MPQALRVTLLSHTRLGQANKFGERRIRAAGAARQSRDKGRDCAAAVPIERPQVHIASGAAGRAPRPQEPITGRDGCADGRREQHWHLLGLALVPYGDEVVGILKDLLLGRAPGSRFLLGLLPAPVLHFALVEAHAGLLVSSHRFREDDAM